MQAEGISGKCPCSRARRLGQSLHLLTATLVLSELDHDLPTEALPLQEEEEVFGVGDWGMSTLLAGWCERRGPAAAVMRHGQE